MKKLIMILISGMVLSTFLIYHINQGIYFKSLIPSKIETNGRDFVSQEFDLFESCGIAVWKLSSDTADAILTNELDFLNQAITAHKKNIIHNKGVMQYSSWQKTSADSEFLSNGLPPAFGCTGDYYQEWKQIVLDMLKNGEGYYTNNGNTMLIAIPKTQRIIITFFD